VAGPDDPATEPRLRAAQLKVTRALRRGFDHARRVAAGPLPVCQPGTPAAHGRKIRSASAFRRQSASYGVARLLAGVGPASRLHLPRMLYSLRTALSPPTHVSREIEAGALAQVQHRRVEMDPSRRPAGRRGGRTRLARWRCLILASHQDVQAKQAGLDGLRLRFRFERQAQLQ